MPRGCRRSCRRRCRRRSGRSDRSSPSRFGSTGTASGRRSSSGCRSRRSRRSPRDHSLTAQMLVLWVATPFLTAAYVCAIVLASPEPLDRATRSSARSPSASSSSCPCRCSCGSTSCRRSRGSRCSGLAVPAAAHERLGFRDALVRGRRLAAADYVHALGSLCALAIVYFITRVMLAAALARSGGRRGARRRVHRRPRHLAAALPRAGAALLRPGRPRRRLRPPREEEAVDRGVARTARGPRANSLRRIVAHWKSGLDDRRCGAGITRFGGFAERCSVLRRACGPPALPPRRTTRRSRTSSPPRIAGTSPTRTSRRRWKQWSVTLPGAVSHPLIANGLVFVTAAEQTVYALNQATGADGVVAPLGGTSPWSGLAYDRGRVFTLDNDGQLTAFDAATGSIAWSVKVGDAFSFNSGPDCGRRNRLRGRKLDRRGAGTRRPRAVDTALRRRPQRAHCRRERRLRHVRLQQRARVRSGHRRRALVAHRDLQRRRRKDVRRRERHALLRGRVSNRCCRRPPARSSAPSAPMPLRQWPALPLSC